jgi:predicted dehydrogenase
MADQKTVNIGMMSFAHMHAKSYARRVNQIANAKLVGIADEDSGRGDMMAKEYNSRYFGSYEELLSSGIDAVIVGSENAKHRKLVEMAAEAGKHVLCEKPLATTMEDGRAMIEACRRNGVKLQAAFPVRYSPTMVELRAMIQAGQLGKVLSLCGTNRGINPNSWFTDASLSGGGAVMDHTVHVVDLMRWLTGAEITEVYAEIDNLINGKDYDDVATLTFELSNGAFGSLDPSWSRPKSFPFWGDVTLEVVGTGGVVGIDTFAQVLQLYSDKDMRHSDQSWGADMDLALLMSFVNAVANDTPVDVTGEDGLAALEVTLAAYESAKRKRSEERRVGKEC